MHCMHACIFSFDTLYRFMILGFDSASWWAWLASLSLDIECICMCSHTHTHTHTRIFCLSTLIATATDRTNLPFPAALRRWKTTASLPFDKDLTSPPPSRPVSSRLVSPHFGRWDLGLAVFLSQKLNEDRDSHWINRGFAYRMADALGEEKPEEEIDLRID